jgi:superfamily I DNA and/or RNA helicase
MRPEISQLMKNFYDVRIEDHESVIGRNDIVGLKNNIFFITHNILEERQNQDETSTTKINRHEAEFAVKLAEYLLKQRQFKPEQITILTMYLGQMSEIKKQMKRFGVEKVKCMTVDNYQGEENEIIILSLVRSNHENKIGFLNVKNRACVALSRARCGLYVIGNFEFICKNEAGNTWKEAVKIAKNIGIYSNYIFLSIIKF